MGKKKSGKKGKGKKGKKGKKSKKKAAAETAEREPTRFPWGKACEEWMSKNPDHRAKLRKEFRKKYTDAVHYPLFDSQEWRRKLMENRMPMRDSCSETMVRLLVVLVRHEGDLKHAADDPIFVAAAIRCKNKEANLRRMYDTFCEFYAKLDMNPDPQDFLKNLDVTFDPDHSDTLPTRSQLITKLKDMGLTSGDLVRLERASLLPADTVPAQRTTPADDGADGSDAGNIDAGDDMKTALYEASQGSVGTATSIDHVIETLEHNDGTFTTQRGSVSVTQLSQMSEMKKVEESILKTLQDDQALAVLWRSIDINRNGTLELVELCSYMQRRFPTVSLSTPTTEAFRKTMIAVKKSPADVAADGGAPTEITRAYFRQFLFRMVYYNRFFAAFTKLDADANRQVDKGEWAKGAPELGGDLDMEFTGSDKEFQEIAGKGATEDALRFPQLCEWYTKKVDEERMTDVEWQGEDVVPEVLRLDDEAQLCDFVMHCHYITRG